MCRLQYAITGFSICVQQVLWVRGIGEAVASCDRILKTGRCCCCVDRGVLLITGADWGLTDYRGGPQGLPFAVGACNVTCADPILTRFKDTRDERALNIAETWRIRLQRVLVCSLSSVGPFCGPAPGSAIFAKTAPFWLVLHPTPKGTVRSFDKCLHFQPHAATDMRLSSLYVHARRAFQERSSSLA